MIFLPPQPDLETAIRLVMSEARMTYHIANCVRFRYRTHVKVKTAAVRAILQRMEKRGEVVRIPYCPRSQPYRKQIAWKLVPPREEYRPQNPYPMR